MCSPIKLHALELWVLSGTMVEECLLDPPRSSRDVSGISAKMSLELFCDSDPLPPANERLDQRLRDKPNEFAHTCSGLSFACSKLVCTRTGRSAIGLDMIEEERDHSYPFAIPFTVGYSVYLTTPRASRCPLVTCCPFDLMTSLVFLRLPWPVCSFSNHQGLSAMRIDAWTIRHTSLF